LEVLANELKVPLKDGVAAQILLREKYDTLYGIFDFDHSARNLRESSKPFALVARHEKERYTVHSDLYRMMQRFIKFKIKDRTGMSWSEFIQQPRDLVIHWFNLCRSEMEREANDPNLKRETKNVEMLERLMGGPRK